MCAAADFEIGLIDGKFTEVRNAWLGLFVVEVEL